MNSLVAILIDAGIDFPLKWPFEFKFSVPSNLSLFVQIPDISRTQVESRMFQHRFVFLTIELLWIHSGKVPYRCLRCLVWVTSDHNWIIEFHRVCSDSIGWMGFYFQIQFSCVIPFVSSLVNFGTLGLAIWTYLELYFSSVWYYIFIWCHWCIFMFWGFHICRVII